MRNAIELMTSSANTAGFGKSKCREAVGGLRWSRDQSTQRLKSIAAVRAQTIQASTRTNTRDDWIPLSATTSALRADGSAKTVCEILISRKNRSIALFGRNSL